VVLRQDHRADEKLFVDFSGDTLPITDPVFELGDAGCHRPSSLGWPLSAVVECNKARGYAPSWSSLSHQGWSDTTR
jgi:hypothetical protein